MTQDIGRVPHPRGRISRQVVGSAKRIFRLDIYPDRRLAIREAIANAMTWMHVDNTHQNKRRIEITINIGNTNELWIEDYGPGIKDYKSFVNMGHDASDKDHQQRMKDENYISQIGIGINSFLGLTEDLVVKFYSVYLDKENRENGLIATMMADDNDIWFVDPEERPAPKYVLPHVGLRVVFNNPKTITKQEIIDLVSETFALKLKDFPVFIRDHRKDTEFTRIEPSTTFCTKHRTELFTLSDGTVVNGDLHPVEKVLDTKIRICIKKVKMQDIVEGIEYLAKGIITTNSLNIQFEPNRTTLRTDDETLYGELLQKLNAWMQEHGFEKPRSDKAPEVKDQRGMDRIITDVFMSLSDIKPDILQDLAGQLNLSGMQGRIEDQKPAKPKFEFYKDNQQIVPTDQKPEGKIVRGNKRNTTKDGHKITISEPPTVEMPPEYYQGYNDGGDKTILKPKATEAKESTGPIIPHIPTIPVPGLGTESNLISMKYNKEQNRIEMIISTDNPLSTGVMSSWGKKQKSIVTPYVCKALCDFVAEKENLDRDEFSKLWENLARRTFYRGSEL